MRLTNENRDRPQNVFGDEFDQQQHRDEAHRNLPPPVSRAIGIATLWLVFFALAVVNVGMKTLGKVVDVVTALGSPQ